MAARKGTSADTAAFAALLNELRGPLIGVAAVRSHDPSCVCCFLYAPRCGVQSSSKCGRG